MDTITNNEIHHMPNQTRFHRKPENISYIVISIKDILIQSA